eukprot:6912397-Prymnesium_polylepis.3
MALTFVGGIVYVLHETRAQAYDRVGVPLRRWVHQIKTRAKAIGFMPKVKLMLTFAQVIACVESTYSVGLPDTWFQ